MFSRRSERPQDAAGPAEEAEKELQALWSKTRDEVIPLCAGWQFHTALERTFAFVTATNAYIEKRAPWKLGKSTAPADQALLRTSLATMAEALQPVSDADILDLAYAASRQR